MNSNGFDHKERERHAKFILGWASFLIILLCSALFLQMFRGCSIEPVSSEIPDSPGSQCKGGLGVGETLQKNCPEGELGQIVLLCKQAGAEPEVTQNSCKAPGSQCEKVTFEKQIKPILSGKCVSCHFTPEPFDKVEVAKVKIDEIIRRVYLDEGNPYHMPKNKSSLPLEEKKLFEDWKEDGLINNDAECRPEGGARTSFNEIERIAKKDLDRIDKNDKIFTRWCEASEVVRTEADAVAIKKALDKTLTSVDNRNVKISLTTLVDPKLALFRFDLRSYDLDRNDWVDFELTEPFNFFSNTDEGKVLRILTATNKPIVHCSNLIDIVNTDADLYYDWLNIPEGFNDLMLQQGVQFGQDIRNFDANFIGFNGSVISNNKNRLLIRHESDYGYMWNTQDTKALNNIRERNIFFAPLTKDTGSLRVFDFAAGESIWSLPNGGQAYALHDKNGLLQKEAPIDVVRDTHPDSLVFPSPVIATASSCHHCHASGILLATDQVRDKLIGDTSFGTQDRIRIQNLYKGKASNDAAFLIDNKKFNDYLSKLGISPSEKDPIHSVRLFLRSDWSAAKTAAYMGLDLSKFLDLLEQSERGKAEVGQLLRGGTATYDSIVAIMPTLIEDFQILEESVNAL